MAENFPTDAGISEMRAMLMIIKGNGPHRLQMTKLAHETRKNADNLFPIIQAAKILGLAKTYDGTIEITPEGSRLSIDNFQSVIKRHLVKAEPFKTSISLISKTDGLRTRELAILLRHSGILLHGKEHENEDLLRYLLLKWGVRCDILRYDARKDIWMIN